MDYKQIEHSVQLALTSYPNLDVIKIFYNCNARLSASSTKQELDKKAKNRGVKLEWLGRSYFEVALNKKEIWIYANCFLVQVGNWNILLI